MKTPNKQVKHAKHIQQQVSKQISLSIKHMTLNIWMLLKQNIAMQKPVQKCKKGPTERNNTRKKVQQICTTTNIIAFDSCIKLKTCKITHHAHNQQKTPKDAYLAR